MRLSRLWALAMAAGVPLAHGDNIEEFIVTASPLSKTGDAVSQAFTTLSGTDLRARAASTIGDTLEGEPGIASASFGPGVGAPVIRGLGGNRVRVLQDNIDSLDASSSSPDHGIMVEPLLAERIEVLRGPATLRYGSGAIGGVVNVIDNRIPDSVPDKLTGGLEYRHGSAGDNDNAVALLEGGAGRLAWHLHGLYRESNDLAIRGPAVNPDLDPDGESPRGSIPNTDSRAHAFTGGFSWVTDRGFIGLSVSRLENEYGIPSGGHAHAEEEDEEEGHDEHEDEHEELVRIDMKQTRTDLKGELNDPLPGFDSLKVRVGHNDYRHIELEGGERGTVFENDAWEGRLELLRTPNGHWRGAVGLQARDRDFAAIGEEAFIPRSDIRSYGLFALEEYSSGPWVVELGLRAERQTIDPANGASVDHNTLNASASVVYQLDDRQHLSLALTRAQRAPTVEELLSEGPHLATASFDIGNRDLDEETSVNIELGYRYHGPVDLDITLFHNDFSDFIYRQNQGMEHPEEHLPVLRYEQEGARLRGIEAELTLPVGELLALRLFGDYVRGELDRGGDIPRITPPRYGLEGIYRHGQWRASLRVTEVGKQRHPGEFENETDGYTKIDGQLDYRLGNNGDGWLFFLRGTNLLDKEIRNATSFLRDVAPEAGRNITAGMRYSF